MSTLQSILSQFSAISLVEMDEVSLLRRTDTKYLIPMSQLPTILTELSGHYQVLKIDEHRVMTYASEYFDTADYAFYHDHHNGISNRKKVRIRHYIETDKYFLEVKQKNGRGTTIKNRIPIAGMQSELSAESMIFISSIIEYPPQLKPTLSNAFKRITLVNLQEKERITIDFEMSFQASGKSERLDRITVIEVKQAKLNRNSAMISSLRAKGFRPFGFSKYCIGLALLNPSLKHNAFKPKFLRINTLNAA